MPTKAVPREMDDGQSSVSLTVANPDGVTLAKGSAEDENNGDNIQKHLAKMIRMGRKSGINTPSSSSSSSTTSSGGFSPTGEEQKSPGGRERKKVRLLGVANGETTPNRDQSPAIPRSPRLSVSRSRKLILHLDLRNTILVADSVTNVAVEQALNSFLTGATWGKEDDKGRWQWTSHKPSVKPPAMSGDCDTEGQMTYYKYLESHLVRTAKDRTALRLATGDFTTTPVGTIFRADFERHLQRLKWQYKSEGVGSGGGGGGATGGGGIGGASPYKTGTGESEGSKPRGTLTMKGTDGQLYHYILEGVYRLIHHLHDTHRDFAVVIRTYGLDAPNALASFAHGVKAHHPGFPRPLNLPVNRSTGSVRRPARDVIVLEAFKHNSDTEIEVKLTHEKDIYRFLSASQGISGYKDDFNHWQDHNYNHHAGKPLWIDPYDTKCQHIIFDDNFRALDDDSIVDVRVFSQEKTTRAYSLGKTQLSRLEDVCLVQADLMESIDDRDYFLRKVELCEANYAHMLKNNAFPS